MKILIVDSIHPIFQDMLESKGFTFDEQSNLSYNEIEAIIHNYEGLVIRSKINLTREILSKAKNLKFICRAGAGMESIDVKFAESKDIKCISAPEGNRDAVGEQCVGMLLTLFNNILRADAEVRDKVWKRAENRGVEIGKKTVGIIGYGNTGSAFAKKLSGFNCNILAHDKYKTGFSNEFVKEASLDELYESCDIVSLHLPFTEETFHYANNAFFSNFKKPVFFVNTSRGKNVNTSDLVSSMKSGKILGVCLDVLELESSSFEKISDENFGDDFNYLTQADNVVLSPHVAGWTHESYRKLSEVLAKKVLDSFSC